MEDLMTNLWKSAVKEFLQDYLNKLINDPRLEGDGIISLSTDYCDARLRNHVSLEEAAY